MGDSGRALQTNMTADTRQTESVSLKDSVQFTLDEARMILPGIQALFGFQLIAIFNERFESDLQVLHKGVHLLALLLVALACALVMAPAAYHRQTEQGSVSKSMLVIASRLIGFGLVPLMLGVSLDVYVVSFLVMGSDLWAAVIGLGCFAVFAGLWFAFPRFQKSRHR
jgi:hypothetical protein